MRTSAPFRGAIVAMNRERVIGVDGDLPWHYSADLKRFKQRTTDATIIMGRLTWQSIGAKPLPNRRNMVISRTTRGRDDGAEWYSSLEQAFDACNGDDSWIIGGGQIYQAAMEWLNLLDITIVPDRVDHPEPVYFPEIDPEQWQVAEEKSLEGAPDLINRIYLRT